MATIRVSSQNELEAALQDVRGGDTILLEAGRYAELSMTTNRSNDFTFTEKVTIASESASNQAQINQVFLRDVANVEFRDIQFHHNGSNAPNTDSFRRDAPFFIESSRNVTIDNGSFKGDLNNGFGNGIGLRVKDSQDVTVSDSTFANFLNGMNISNSDGLTFARNLLTGMANDGMTFGGVTDVLIDANTFRDFKSPNPGSAHKDNIQFRVDIGEAPSKNVIIRDNVMNSAENRHGIFMGNELVKDGIRSNVAYENILIEGNYISAAQLHGITIFHGNGLDIRNNTLVGNNDRGFDAVPRINVAKYSDNVDITGNTVSSVPDAENNSWNVSGNNTGGRNIDHWNGTENNPQYNAANYGGILPPPSGGNVGGGGDGGGDGGGSGGGSGGDWRVVDLNWRGVDDELRINGFLVEDRTRILVDNLNVEGNDTLVLNGFGNDRFDSRSDGNPLQVWRGGASARIDDMLDIRELDATSDRVSTSTRNGDLVLEISSHRGLAEIVFDGWADLY